MITERYVPQYVPYAEPETWLDATFLGTFSTEEFKEAIEAVIACEGRWKTLPSRRNGPLNWRIIKRAVTEEVAMTPMYEENLKQ